MLIRLNFGRQEEKKKPTDETNSEVMSAAAERGGGLWINANDPGRCGVSRGRAERLAVPGSAVRLPSASTGRLTKGN